MLKNDQIICLNYISKLPAENRPTFEPTKPSILGSISNWQKLSNSTSACLKSKHDRDKQYYYRVIQFQHLGQVLGMC